MTKEDRFQRDWTLSEEIDKSARADLERGLSIDQAMENVLRSDVYAARLAEERTFRVDWDRREHYEDLLGNIRSGAYAKRILSIGERYMADPNAVAPEAPDSSPEYDPVFKQLGMDVSVDRLGCEIARLSSAIGLDIPMPYKAFLSFFTGTATFGLDGSQIRSVLRHDQDIIRFVETFARTYRTVRGYSMPDALRTLMEIDDELRLQDGMSIEEGLGVALHFTDRFEYECAPEDAIPFASTGVGGDHFAFLAKDDSVATLEEAPILFIQPMDFDVPVKLAARNLKEFLSLFLALKELYVLERFPRYETEEQFLKDYRDIYLPGIEARREALQRVTEAMERKLGLSPIGDVYAYMKKLSLNKCSDDS